MEAETTKRHIISILCIMSSCYPLTRVWEGPQQSSELILMVLSVCFVHKVTPQEHISCQNKVATCLLSHGVRAKV